MIKEALAAVLVGDDISENDSYRMMAEILSGVTSTEQNVYALKGLASKGETDAELSGMLKAMREAGLSVEIRPSQEAVDVCGMGGDGLRTVNISTATAFVAAACGCNVAKHGNRSNSGGIGSADIFEALGCDLQASSEDCAECLEKTGVCFMFAPRYHPEMRHVAEARKTIGTRTAFNILGPLCNPARVKRHLVGVSSKDLLKRIPILLLKNHSNRAVSVMSESGMDELSTAGKCHVFEADGNSEKEYTISPGQLGLHGCEISELQVAGKEDALAAFVLAIDGTASRAICDTVQLNAGAALLAAGKCESLEAGLEMASGAVKSGKAAKTLESFVKHCGSADSLEGIRKNV